MLLADTSENCVGENRVDVVHGRNYGGNAGVGTREKQCCIFKNLLKVLKLIYKFVVERTHLEHFLELLQYSPLLLGYLKLS